MRSVKALSEQVVAMLQRLANGDLSFCFRSLRLFCGKCRRLSQLAGRNSLIVICACVAYPAFADQTDPRLPELFERLQASDDPVQARQIESQIWTIWSVAPDKNAQLLLEQMSQAMEAGLFDFALTLANQLVDSSPDFAEAWNKRATLHYMMGNLDDSVADIRETLTLEPKHFGAISGLGLIFMRQENFEAALQAFEQVLTVTPASASAKASIRRVRAALGQEI